MKHHRELLGTFITLLGATMWGLNSVAGKYIMGVKGVDPAWMVTLRLISAGTIFLCISFIKGNTNAETGEEVGSFEIWKDKNSVLRLLVVAIFAFAICQATYFAAIDYSNAGISTAIQQTSPAFVLLWVLLIERRFPHKREILVLALVIFGAFMLATGGNIHALIIPAMALIMGLTSAVTCAMYTLLPGKLIKRYGTFCTAGWGMLLGGIFLAPIVQLWHLSGTWDFSTILVFSFVVIFGTVTAFGSYLYGVTLVGPIKGSILGLFEPVVATLASAIILGQHFSIGDIIGIVAILIGVVVSTLK